jgi:hypothetical protein
VFEFRVVGTKRSLTSCLCTAFSASRGAALLALVHGSSEDLGRADASLQAKMAVGAGDLARLDNAAVASLAGALSSAEVGYFDAEPSTLAEWLCQGLSQGHHIRDAGVETATQAADLIAPGGPLTLRVVFPRRNWSMLVTDGPHGTDLGMLPSLAARELGCTGIRAVCLADGAGPYPARILEVFGPDGVPPLLAVRSIAASYDGGRWVFETSGEVLPFEDEAAYNAARKADRFSPALLLAYLSKLGVRVDVEPKWEAGLLISR